MWSIIWAKKQLLTLAAIIWWVIREFFTDTAMQKIRDFLSRWRPAMMVWDFLGTHPALIALIIFAGVSVWGYIETRKRKKGKTMSETKEEKPTVLKDTQVKLDAKDTEKATGMEITKPTELNNVKVDVTAQNVREATGLKVTAINTEFALSSRVIMCSCGNILRSVTTHGYKPTVKCPKCGKEYSD